MDTEFDFLQPEFFNLLFFQQKSLIIFPYVDVKHLKILEIFTEGYNIINLDCTALNNLQDILSHDSINSYSNKPSFYFIMNASSEIVNQVLDISHIHCIINSKENLYHLIRENNYIFYNKKNNSFLNYDFSTQNLSFENEILHESSNDIILQEKIHRIKLIATKIFTALNQYQSIHNIQQILQEYDCIYWEKILQFTRLFYNIEIPDIPHTINLYKKNSNKKLKDFSNEYQLIIKSNRKIGQEFVHALHDYRLKHVNPAHLELEQLFYPEQLYSYLRNHHWAKNIPQDFIDEWLLMKNTNHSLNANDLLDFKCLFNKLDNPCDIKITSSQNSYREPNLEREENLIKKPVLEYEIPSIQDFTEFKIWILNKVEQLEKIFQKPNEIN